LSGFIIASGSLRIVAWPSGFVAFGRAFASLLKEIISAPGVEKLIFFWSNAIDTFSASSILLSFQAILLRSISGSRSGSCTNGDHCGAARALFAASASTSLASEFASQKSKSF
jgi:hypothetical protein